MIESSFYLTRAIRRYQKTYPTMQFEFEEIGNGFKTSFSYEKQKISSKIQLSKDGIKNEAIILSKIEEDIGKL